MKNSELQFYNLQLFISSDYLNMSWDDSLQLMNRLTDQVQAINYPLLLQTAQTKYNISEFKITQITPNQAYQIYASICKSIKKKPSKKNAPAGSQLNWGQNELKLFIWVLICYLELKKQSVQNLNTQNWQFFSKLFPKKNTILFEYQALMLRKDSASSNKWTQQEDQIFSQVVSRSQQQYKWSEHAKQLYILSNKKYFRTAKQCRQRWFNHLGPSKSKQEWQPREDYILIAHVHTKGKKWAQIAKMLKNRRNEHSIKNRFKSLITKEEKLHSEKFEEKELVRFIYKSYQTQFIQKSFVPVEQSKKNQIQPPSQNLQKYTNDYPVQNKQIFQISSSSTVKSQTKDSACLGSANNVAAPLHQCMISSFPSDNSQNPQLYQRSQFQKQIRADMFLSIDPFQFLKRFFHSKDSQIID